MLVIRLIHLKEMPSYENILDSIKKNNLNENETEEITIGQDRKNILREEKKITETSKRGVICWILRPSGNSYLLLSSGAEFDFLEILRIS